MKTHYIVIFVFCFGLLITTEIFTHNQSISPSQYKGNLLDAGATTAKATTTGTSTTTEKDLPSPGLQLPANVGMPLAGITEAGNSQRDSGQLVKALSDEGLSRREQMPTLEVEPVEWYEAENLLTTLEEDGYPLEAEDPQLFNETVKDIARISNGLNQEESDRFKSKLLAIITEKFAPPEDGSNDVKVN